MEKETKKTGALVPGLLIAVAAGLLLVGALWFFASRRAAPPSMAGSGGAEGHTVSLFTAPEPVEAEAPAPVPAPDVEAADPYGFDEILAQEDGLLLARIQGKRYRGFIAIVEDPFRVRVGTCGHFGEAARGRRLAAMADAAGAILAVNGGGFDDPNGGGRGGQPEGNVIMDGQLLWGGWGPTVAMDGQGKLYAGNYTSRECMENGFQWALSYGPNLIQNGVICSGLSDNLSEPRTAVGQREDGSIVLLNIQGRQPSALGVTYRELAEIMAGYGCVDAGNLDGGASSDIYYRGEYVNIANSSGGPRPIPTCLMVMPVEGGDGE